MYIRRYRPGDAEQLAPLVADTDRREIYDANGGTVLAELRFGSLYSQPCYTLFDREGGTILAMLGVVPITPPSPPAGWRTSSGRVWMITQPALKAHSRAFLRAARPFLHRLHRRYPLLFNIVAEYQTDHIRWLRWMGFTFLRHYPAFGLHASPFLEFARLGGSVLPCA